MNFNKFQKISISLFLIVFLFSIFYFLFFIDLAQAGGATGSWEEGQLSSNIDASCKNYQYPWCSETEQGIAPLVNQFYKIALGLAGASALGVLIYGAILWTLSGAVTSKQDAKEWISGALWGLALLLGAYLILNTINPRLVELKEPSIDAVKIEAPVVYESDVAKKPFPVAPEANKMFLDSKKIPIKSGACNGPCMIDFDTNINLTRFVDELNLNNIKGLVTEAYPPTRTHSDPCHARGTCVDWDFSGTQATADNIQKVINAASKAGAYAVYEYPKDSAGKWKETYDTLVKVGVPKENILPIDPNKITGDHFSVYGPEEKSRVSNKMQNNIETRGY